MLENVTEALKAVHGFQNLIELGVVGLLSCSVVWALSLWLFYRFLQGTANNHRDVVKKLIEDCHQSHDQLRQAHLDERRQWQETLGITMKEIASSLRECRRSIDRQDSRLDKISEDVSRLTAGALNR